MGKIQKGDFVTIQRGTLKGEVGEVTHVIDQMVKVQVFNMTVQIEKDHVTLA